MKGTGRLIFFAGMSLALALGSLLSLGVGTVCQLSEPPQTIWSYPAFCFATWAYGVPVGIILAATGVLAGKGGFGRSAVSFLAGALAVYLVVTIANGPLRHYPPFFGAGGTLILIFYGLILWQSADRLRENLPRLAGYTSLLIGLWFTCGLASRLYQPMLDSGESPIDIMTWFILAMAFFALGERRAAVARRRMEDHGATVPG